MSPAPKNPFATRRKHVYTILIILFTTTPSNIKRIVFETIDKYDGKHFRKITAPHLKQIAGRAGRFGTQFEAGEVTT